MQPNNSCASPCSSGACISPRTDMLRYPIFDDCQKYSKHDGCLIYENSLVRSLTDEPNSDNPLEGVLKHPPTWEVGPACSLMNHNTLTVENGEYKWVSADGNTTVTWSACSLMSAVPDNGNSIGG